MKKTIVQITPSSLGGIGRLTVDISDILQEEGFNSHIAYARGEVRVPQRDYMFGSIWDVRHHALMTRLTDKIGCYSKRATKKLIGFLESIDVDLVQLHNLHGYYVNLEILFDYLRQKNIPVVWTLHECWAFTGHCTHFSYIGCDKWKNECFNCPQTSSYPKSFKDNSRFNYNLKKRLFTSLDNMTIITPSLWLANIANQSFLKKYPISVINNGIDLSVFRIKDIINYSIPCAKNKKIVLGLASQFGEKKGYHDFIQLSKLLPEEYVIILVGVNGEQIKVLPNNVIGIEHTENVDELVDIYNQAFIFLNLTYEDNFPTTNLEAQACGTSVLTYDTGGSPESIIDGTGYVVPQHDLSLVKEIIMKHNKTPDSKNLCRKNALKYDKQSCFKKYVELYSEILLRDEKG